MQAQRDNISNLIVSDFWFKALFSSYSVICSPWRPLWEIQSQANTKLSTADCFSTRQSHLCHRPGSNTSEKTKTRLSKASCYLPRSLFSNGNKTSGSIAPLASPRANCTTRDYSYYMYVPEGMYNVVWIISGTTKTSVYCLLCQIPSVVIWTSSYCSLAYCFSSLCLSSTCSCM